MTESTSPEILQDEEPDLPWHSFDLGPLPHGPRAEPAPRSGQPWTDAEYEQILAAVREGVTDMAEIAARIGRGISPTMAKARRLLPLAERSAPIDRVFRLLREHQDDPDYDWRRTTLEEPPPRPVVQPPALTGIPGLESEDLMAIGYAVGLVAPAVGEDVVARVGRELYRRGLVRRLVEHRAERLVQGTEISWDRAVSEADTWVARSFGTTRLPPDAWYPDDRYADAYPADAYPAPAHW